MCHEQWALPTVIKRELFYLYICSLSAKLFSIRASVRWLGLAVWPNCVRQCLCIVSHPKYVVIGM